MKLLLIALSIILASSAISCCWSFSLLNLPTKSGRYPRSCCCHVQKNIDIDDEDDDARVVDSSKEAIVSNRMSTTRRDVIDKTGKMTLSALVGTTMTTLTSSNKANAAAVVDDIITEKQSSPPSSVSFGASWTAVDGLNSLESKSQFVSFDVSAYKAMRDDPTRTPQFQKAIEAKLGNKPENMVVVDLGTGPFALFALIAAQLGAGKVYAIEANPDAAQSARETIKKAAFDDIITVIEDFSSNVVLDEKADFCIAEIVGSIASEEGAYATIRSAHSNLLKDPNNDSSWIPSRIQTYAAPASYTLHNLFGPPEFDWTKLKDPVDSIVGIKVLNC